jgi:hypothetical protein
MGRRRPRDSGLPGTPAQTAAPAKQRDAHWVMTKGTTFSSARELKLSIPYVSVFWFFFYKFIKNLGNEGELFSQFFTQHIATKNDFFSF